MMGYHGLAEKVEDKLSVLKFISRFEKLQLPFDHSAFVAQDKQVCKSIFGLQILN